MTKKRGTQHTKRNREARVPALPAERVSRDLSAGEAFEAAVGAARAAAPSVTDALVAAHRARGARLLRVSTVFNPALAGLEELHRALVASSDALAGSSVPGTAPLVARAVGDLETAFECLLAGRHQVVSDAMRDTMEIELLLLSFASDPETYEEWVAADRHGLVSKFGPEQLRKRIADAQFEIPMDLPDKFEYQMHSSIAHPTNSGAVETAFHEQATDDDLAVCLAEMLGHGRRVLSACATILQGEAPGVLEAAPDLSELRSLQQGWEHLQFGLRARQDAVLAAGILPPRGPLHRGAWKGFGTQPPKRKGNRSGA